MKMNDNFNLILKYLKRKNWNYDGTQYIFRDISINDSYINSIIDCVLPKKGQSYTRGKFVWSLEQIMKDVHDMFGEKVAFEVDFFVDGKTAENVYLSDEVKKEIREELKKFNWYELKGKPPIDTRFSCELKVFPSTKKPQADYENVEFNFFWDVFNITVNDISVEVDSNFYQEAKGYIETLMMDNDFSSDVSDIFYLATEKDFQFRNTDMYVIANGYLRKIDGVDNGHGIWKGELNTSHLFSARK